jgi:hypothetical protein
MNFSLFPIPPVAFEKLVFRNFEQEKTVLRISAPLNPNFSPLLSDTAKQCHTAIARMIL